MYLNSKVSVDATEVPFYSLLRTLALLSKTYGVLVSIRVSLGGGAGLAGDGGPPGVGVEGGAGGNHLNIPFTKQTISLARRSLPTYSRILHFCPQDTM
jgi:hypothetical protein